MKWLLVYYDDAILGEQWRRFFGGRADVEVLHGDICRVKADAVVSPANSFGFMDGGLDYALSERFGWGVQERLQQAITARPLKELLVGEAMVVPTGDPEVPWLISAPTMRVPMRLRQSVNAYLAMKAILVTASAHAASPPIRSVAIPGLGTGCGGLDAETAALQIWTAYREVILEEWRYPEDFGEAQKRHLQLNVKEIMIWD
jgi:O-acetyl-ADP-ribose deacetylase (regulator of RNase III)